MNTCNKCNNLPQSGYVYVIDSLWLNKITNKNIKRVNTEASLSSINTIESNYSNIFLENEGISTANLSKANAAMLVKTYYACGEHEQEVKKEMLENIRNLNHDYDEKNNDVNIISFPIVNSPSKPKKRFWRQS